MWTKENRAGYDRRGLRYPSDLTDEEWAVLAPLIPRAKRGGNKRSVDERSLINGLLYILSTGCQWRAIPKDFPPRSTLFGYFQRWEWTARLRGSITLFISNAERKLGEMRAQGLPSLTARA